MADEALPPSAYEAAIQEWGRTYRLKAALLAAAPLIRAAERERIRQLADRTEAVCPGDDGTSCYFSALLGEVEKGPDFMTDFIPGPGTEPS